MQRLAELAERPGACLPVKEMEMRVGGGGGGEGERMWSGGGGGVERGRRKRRASFRRPLVLISRLQVTSHVNREIIMIHGRP